MTEKSKDDIWFVYDGDCPICQMGASLFKVRQSVGTLHTVNARTEKEHPVYIEVNNAKLNLDDGMIIKYQENLYQGDAALHMMAQLGDDNGLFNKVNNTLFTSPSIAKLCYPSMRAARNIVLKVKGVKPINNLESPHE